jgi:hypothetical protein
LQLWQLDIVDGDELVKDTVTDQVGPAAGDGAMGKRQATASDKRPGDHHHRRS